MQSSSGKYFLGLDHIRGLAAFMVFAWHFIHVNDQHLAEVSLVPFLTEGHTGVALFMTLSGYLFAKLLEDKRVHFGAFLWNRCLRLLPLLMLVIFIVGCRDYFFAGETFAYLRRVIRGVLAPTLPNGGWSITVEFHFYLLLPLLLMCVRRSPWLLLLFVAAAVAIRAFLYSETGEVQKLAYATIFGRLDQFVLGILAYQVRHLFSGRHLLAAAVLIGFTVFYAWFEAAGGYYQFDAFPSSSAIWVVLTTIEGFAYASLIAWYDNSFKHSSGWFSRFLARVGTYSYSIYLLHFFFYAELAALIDEFVLPLTNVYLALAFAPLAFLCMIPLGYLSFRFVEAPFLRFRTVYLQPPTPAKLQTVPG